MLNHGGETYKVYGVSGVFTYPAFRKEGFGAQIVEAATRHIDASDADFALLFCLPELEAFYARHGWEVMRGTRISYGKPDAPEVDDHAFTMVRFVSPKGQQVRASLAKSIFYVGPYMW
jgi:predicted acetyltransferase